MGQAVGGEAKEMSQGLAAEGLARDVKEPDTNPLGQWFLILTALEKRSAAFRNLQCGAWIPPPHIHSRLKWAGLGPGH